MTNAFVPGARPEPAAVETRQRFDSIDILRGIALFGVLTVNLVTEFRVSIFSQFLHGFAEPKLIDRIVSNVIFYGLELKAFALFSFLFGVGMAIQYERLSRTGRPLYWLARRLFVLLGLGLVHLLLIWNGDILTEYAVAGLIVLPLLRVSQKVLALAAIGLFVLYLALPAIPMPVMWPDAAWIANHIQQANRVYRNGCWYETILFSLRELPYLLPLHVYIFPRTLALFVLGVLAWRNGIFSRAIERKSTILNAGWLCGVLALATSVIGESGPFPINWLPNGLANLTPVLMALAFAAILVYAVEFSAASACLRFFAPIGRMAFSNYILQSIVFGFVFFGYGLGQFGLLRPAPVFMFGIALYLCQVQLSRSWLRRYRFGPIEWVWRTLMYGKRQPLKP